LTNGARLLQPFNPPNSATKPAAGAETELGSFEFVDLADRSTATRNPPQMQASGWRVIDPHLHDHECNRESRYLPEAEILLLI